MMTPEELLDKLRPLQESKGYFFNRDRAFVLDLMESLLVNRDRYGYMACPCRLASGNRDLDKDIFCPCVYREPTWPSSAPATAASTSPRTGTRTGSRTRSCPSAATRKSSWPGFSSRND